MNLGSVMCILVLVATVLALALIAILNLIILADLIKKRIVVASLSLMSASFIMAFAFENNRPDLLFLGFLCCFFFLPLVRFFSMYPTRIITISSKKSERMFEGLIILAVFPCLVGIVLTIAVANAILTDRHGLTGGNWAYKE